MENASKALLIAGSILIAIILIAVAVRMLSSTTGTVEVAQSTMKTMEIQMFNTKFTQFAGSHKNSSDAIAVLQAINANNTTNSERKVLSYIRKKGESVNTQSDPLWIISNRINGTSKYKIECKGGKDNQDTSNPYVGRVYIIEE